MRLIGVLTCLTTADSGSNQRSVTDWIDSGIFSVHGYLTVEREEEQGRYILARYRNDTCGRDVELLAVPGGGGQDQPDRHRTSKS